MKIPPQLLLAIGLPLLGLALGLLLRHTSGRFRQTRGGENVDLAELAVIREGVLVKKWARRRTFVQFSSEYCTACRQTARVLGDLTRHDPDALHLEVDITNRLHLARKYRILQTPTTLIVGPRGQVLGRIVGQARAATIEHETEKASYEI